MWTSAQTTLLNAILNQLIPANNTKGIPGAGDIPVSQFIARQAATDMALAQHVSSLLRLARSSAGGVTTDLVRQLETEQPEAFSALLTATYKGYYSRPDMRAKVGVGAHPVHPDGYDVPHETSEMMEHLTAPVRARGPVFRDPTGGQS